MKKARIRDWVRVLLLLFSVRQIVYSFGKFEAKVIT